MISLWRNEQEKSEKYKLQIWGGESSLICCDEKHKISEYLYISDWIT